uniref:ATP synthase complex subunit 8 n=1 Tax=Proasellus beticus TaxID=1281946 RepID=A0A485M6Y0_9CRUS|nr:ATP synthase 8 [Proasellus beticus]
MPQMAPMFWTFLMVLFTGAFLLFMVKLYFYLSTPLSQTSKKQMKELKNQWSW